MFFFALEVSEFAFFTLSLLPDPVLGRRGGVRVSAGHHGLGNDRVWHVGNLSPAVACLPPLARVVQDLQYLSSGVVWCGGWTRVEEEEAATRSACGKRDIVSMHMRWSRR